MKKSSVPFPREAFRPTGQNIYFDHNATTPIPSFIKEAVPNWLEEWGNAGSIHQTGRGPKAILRESRQKVAQLIGANQLEIIFTSGGTEANNFALKGMLDWSLKNNKSHWIVSAVEHPSLMQAAKYLTKKGIRLSILPVAKDGSVSLNEYKKLLNEETGLVSMMIANNETGSIFPIKEMARLAHDVGAYFHSDGVQALGKMSFDVKDLGIDMMSFSSHKFYSLKGAGLLYVKKSTPIEALLHGGSQERKRRAGTENILAIASLGKMSEAKGEIAEFCEDVKRLRDEMEIQIIESIQGVSINGAGVERVCGTSSLIIDGIDGETLLMNLDVSGFSVSTGAACSSGNPEPSPVLLAMGLSREEAQASLRVSLGWGNTREEINHFVVRLKEIVIRLREMKRS